MALTTLNQLNDSMQKWALKETQKMQTDLFTGIQNDTPVKTGKAKAGWVEKEVTKLGNTGVIENNVEYIGWIEFGSDTIAPHAMVRNNIKKVTGK